MWHKKTYFCDNLIMKRILHTYIALFMLPFLVSAQTILPFVVGNDSVVPKCEYRAVWLTTIENLDWPRTKVREPGDVELQKNELVVLLDSLQDMRINTVLLQVRVRGDVIYPSKIESFSHVLTGVYGKNPGYDPLAFAIDECHKRGMQLHAWLVALPLGKSDHVARHGRNALPNKRRNLCARYKGAWYMEPGNPETAGYITSLVKEIVQGYDVDGIHLDYVRYPDTVDGYPDAALYRKYGKGKSLAAWRRDNITRIAASVYAAVKELKPWVRVSCAPLGKYGELARYSSYGWDAYNRVYQDAQGWLRDGIMDILFPMIYFDGNNFYPFVRDWCENRYGRHVAPGVGIYRLMPKYGGWHAIEIERQMRTSRSAGADGIIMFRTAHLVGNAGGARDIYTKVYNTPALVPPMEWASDAPSAPSIKECMRDENGVVLSWGKVQAADAHPAIRYNVYAALGDSVDISDCRNLVAVSLTEETFTWRCRTKNDIAVAVTAVNAYGVESEPVYASAVIDGSMVRDEVIALPEPLSWGQRIRVRDIYGREVYFGKFKRRFNVGDFAAGHYILTVHNRHGVLLHSLNFVR